jgi:hypothetical protein
MTAQHYTGNRRHKAQSPTVSTRRPEPPRNESTGEVVVNETTEKGG